MANVVVVAGIGNELEAKDVASIQQLMRIGKLEKGEVHFIYYLPYIPGFAMWEPISKMVPGWKAHANQIIDSIGNKLGIPIQNRHVVDEILGPDKVFSDAKELGAKFILTSHPDELRPRPLSRMYDAIVEIFKGKTGEIKKETPSEFVAESGVFIKEVEAKKSAAESEAESAVYPSPVFHKKLKTHKKKVIKEAKEEERKYGTKPK